jgi:hypothetical protein
MMKMRTMIVIAVAAHEGPGVLIDVPARLSYYCKEMQAMARAMTIGRKL